MKKLIVPISIALFCSCGQPEEQVSAPYVDSTSLSVDTHKVEMAKDTLKKDSVVVKK